MLPSLRRFWPSLAFYGGLLFFAWPLGGIFAAAVIEFLGWMAIVSAILYGLLYKAIDFTRQRRLSLAGTAVTTVAMAGLAAYSYLRAASGGSAHDLQRALEWSMMLVQVPLLHLEYNWRVARAQRTSPFTGE